MLTMEKDILKKLKMEHRDEAVNMINGGGGNYVCFFKRIAVR